MARRKVTPRTLALPLEETLAVDGTSAVARVPAPRTSGMSTDTTSSLPPLTKAQVHYLRELFGGDPLGQWTPAIAIAQQDQEVEIRGEVLAALQLSKTDRERAPDLARFLAHAPAQVNRLEAEALLAAEVLQGREDVLL